MSGYPDSMGKGRSSWQDGRRAWQRLNGWHQDDPSATPGHPDDGASALDALSDIGRVRHLLDQAELVAVRTARRHKMSWAEIATKLGVTRQSAWERWRDLDDAAESPTYLGQRDADDIIERAARELRRSSKIVVPNVVGMSWEQARDVLRGKGLHAIGPNPDAAPLTVVEWPTVVVTDQSPESGAKVPIGASVTLWVERGGGSGVREPLRPKPDPRTARAMRDEASDQAVG
jgi:PASTA domain